eukprot:TRINITY_DN584_c0_g1_i1.p1 TRINITY_DN584_c0_g1~~TRINITY_DN584_c0_g1_i1.p1  ORF type:complete len:249 (+),score=20.41 TRINITY_DN584_c0_g1_i1:34-780(+)
MTLPKLARCSPKNKRTLPAKQGMSTNEMNREELLEALSELRSQLIGSTGCNANSSATEVPILDVNEYLLSVGLNRKQIPPNAENLMAYVSQLEAQFAKCMVTLAETCSKKVEDITLLIDDDRRLLSFNEVDQKTGMVLAHYSLLRLKLQKEMQAKLIALVENWRRQCSIQGTNNGSTKRGPQSTSEWTPEHREILNQWYNKNISHPFPSDCQKERLARQTQKTVTQINNWFGNKRHRSNKMHPNKRRS